MSKVLSAETVQRLERDGYLTGIPVLSPEEVRRYRANLEQFERDHSAHIKKLKSKAEVLSPWIVDFATSPRLLDAFEDIFGPNLFLRGVAWRNKAPDGSTFAGWHQDTAYGVEMTPRHFTAVLALSDCSETTGCLRVIPGSHKWPLLEHADYDDPTSILARGQQIVSDFDRSHIANLALKPGEMAIFDPAIVHGSSPNVGTDRRIMALITMIPTHAVRQDGVRETAMLVRGIDKHDTFDHEPRPQADCGERELAAWTRVIEQRARFIFKDSALSPSEAYGGTRPAA